MEFLTLVFWSFNTIVEHISLSLSLSILVLSFALSCLAFLCKEDTMAGALVGGAVLSAFLQVAFDRVASCEEIGRASCRERVFNWV